jgi:hypothetical protein
MVLPSCDTTSTTTLNAKDGVDSVRFPWTATVMPALTLEKTSFVVTSTRDTDTGATPALTSLPLDHAQAQCLPQPTRSTTAASANRAHLTIPPFR